MDGMLVHHRATPQQYVAGIHLYSYVKRQTGVKFPFQRNNMTLSFEPPTSSGQSGAVSCLVTL